MTQHADRARTRRSRIALCGGIYSNPYALRAFVADARRRGADRLICLGDFGAYGAEPEAVWPLLDEHGIECIAGNYEVAIGSRQADCLCGYTDDTDNAFGQIAYDYTFAHTSEAFAAWMATLPIERRFDVDGVAVHLVHGSPLQLNDFWWESLDDDAHRMRADASGADVVCCTHSGLPWTRRITRSDGGETLAVNVGVLGRPANDGERHVWYALLDLDDGAASAELVPLDYDWRAQAASIRAAGLPESFAEVIETGWWTSCLEILPPAERSRGRFQLYRSVLAQLSGVDPTPGDRPVVPLFGSELFPPRLWIYTNFDCNLACSYCSVASSPQAPRRRLGLGRFTALVDEALDAGVTEVYVTGGEPFLENDLVEMLLYAAERLEVVCLTNGMLYRGRRRAELERLAGHPGLTLQTSLDGSEGAHDAQRGRGTWARAMEGVDIARSLGLPVRVGMTETSGNAGQGDALRTILADHDVAPEQVAVRPLVARGNSAEGVLVAPENTVPELTVAADGWFWHPAGADRATSPDMLIGSPEVGLVEARRRVVERFLTMRQRDGSLPTIYQCAV
ncbi:radical SAM protein [Actinomycetospora endophytica]|uniref:Radical SAM protein n=1 Tax=Actinomycetospora endophytica TaxID=2291215 RepID=A0ABS8P655_9PSEU|nr:radical SAM protein [Actinomycetospora endophytica]MCD2193735.1 radical SAM protein [Actinomycetospora endophytica]